MTHSKYTYPGEGGPPNSVAIGEEKAFRKKPANGLELGVGDPDPGLVGVVVGEEGGMSIWRACSRRITVQKKERIYTPKKAESNDTGMAGNRYTMSMMYVLVQEINENSLPSRVESPKR